MEDIFAQYYWIKWFFQFRVVLVFIFVLALFSIVICSFPVKRKYQIGFSIVALLAFFLAILLPDDLSARMSLATQISHELRNDKLLPEEREILVRLFTDLSTSIATGLDHDTYFTRDQKLVDQFVATLHEGTGCSKEFKD